MSNGGNQRFATGLIFVAAFCISRFLAKNEIVAERENAASNSGDRAGNPSDLLGSAKRQFPQVSPNSRNTDQKSHEAQEEDYWFYTKWAAVCAAGGAIIAAGFAAGAFYQALRQANAADEGNRPWLQITSVDFGKYHFSKDILNAALIINFENIGHQPARGVFSKMYGPIRNFDYTDKTNVIEVCTGKPENGISLGTGVYFPSKDIQNVQGLIYHSPTPGETRLPPQFIGCLFYRDNNDNLHVSAFLYYLLINGKPPVITGAEEFDEKNSRVTSRFFFPNIYAD